MEFLWIHENKLKVILSASDMEDLGLECDVLDYADPVTRNALVEILERGRAEVRFHPRNAKLFVEAYPCDEDGCVLYFTSLPGNIRRAGHNKNTDSNVGLEPVLFGFDGAEELVEGACKTFERYGSRIYRSSLYRFHGQYRLVVYPLDYYDRLSIYFLSEFGHQKGRGELLAAYIAEHGKELIGDDALETLAYYFSD